MDAKVSPSRGLRVGLAGAGGIAPEHFDALALVSNVEVVAVCDLFESRAQSFASLYRIPRAYSSLTKMLNEEKLDVVHVLTQPQNHFAAAMTCLEAGAGVYIEKPMCTSTADCQTIADEAAKRGLPVGVNHNTSFAAAIDEVVEAVKERRFGRINHVAVTFSMPAHKMPDRKSNHFMFSSQLSLIEEFCPHPFSVIRLLLGKPIEVRALFSDPFQQLSGNRCYATGQVAAVAERGSAQLYFSAGRGNQEFGVWVYGQDGSATIDLIRGTSTILENCPDPIMADLRGGLRNAGRIFRQSVGKIAADRLVKLKLKPAKETNGFYPAFENFYSAVREGRPNRENAMAGRDVLAYCEMAIANASYVD
jgi:predicted dehydrogenase